MSSAPPPPPPPTTILGCLSRVFPAIALATTLTIFCIIEPRLVFAAPPPTPERDVNTMLRDADLLVKNKHLSEARFRLRQLISRPDAPAAAYCALAETYLDYEGVDEDTPVGVAAMQGLQTALKKDPNFSRAYKDLATLANLHGNQERCFNQLMKCLEAQSKFAQIDALISKDIAKDSHNFELLDLRGQYRMKDKKIAAALADFSAAIKIEPASLFYEHRAAAYDALGRKQEADQDRAAGKKAVSKDFL